MVLDALGAHRDALSTFRHASLQEPISAVLAEPCADQPLQLAERAELCGEAFVRKI